MRRVAVPLCFALAACAGAPGAVVPTPTPATVLRITVVYPKTTDVVQSRDSAFLFGSAGRGDAVLTINGAPVAVHPNGAWIAWLPLPDDTIAPFRIVATAAGDSQVV
jgi:N-acetylmuramoyl-L-alanine amidase